MRRLVLVTSIPASPDVVFDLATDLVDVAAPFWRPGRMFEGFIVRYLERLLAERNQAILESATGS